MRIYLQFNSVLELLPFILPPTIFLTKMFLGFFLEQLSGFTTSYEHSEYQHVLPFAREFGLVVASVCISEDTYFSLCRSDLTHITQSGSLSGSTEVSIGSLTRYIWITIAHISLGTNPSITLQGPGATFDQLLIIC